MKKKILGLLLLLVAATFTAFIKADTHVAIGKYRNVDNNPIAGKWVHKLGGISVLLTANADFTSNISVNGHITSTGSYQIKGNIVTLINKTEPRGLCIGTLGLYNFSIKGEVLTMVLNNDPCAGRSRAVEGIWTKQ